MTKFSSSGLPFLEPFFFLSLVFGSLFLFGCALLVLWSPSFISFFPLTYVYDICKCGGVIRYTVRRPKYPSKSSFFLGSLSISTLMCRLVDPSEGSTKTHISVNFTLKFLGSTLPTSPATLDPSPLPRHHAKRKEGI